MSGQGGIYIITKSGTTGFTPLGVLRNEAFKEVNRFADEKKKIAEIVSVNEVPAGFARWPQVEVKFRLVDEESRSDKGKTPTIEVTGSSSYDAMGRPQNKDLKLYHQKEVDVYEELKKLGELREKGILTEEEFQREKERLLNSERN